LSAGSASSKDISLDLLFLLLIAVTAVFVCFKIFTHGIMYAADDIWWHMLWLKDFIGELNEGILYPRWLAHSHYLYGSPILVFYPPLCFYLGAAISKGFSLSIMQTSTAIFAVGAFGSGATFYFCARQRWGKLPAAIGALMITASPYVTVDIYVRGSVGEVFALSWLPLIMMNVDRVHLKSGKLFLALGVGLTALTHVPSLVMYSCAWFIRLCFCSVRTVSGINRIFVNCYCYALGLGCAALFILPVLFERKFVDIDALRAFDVWKTNFFFTSDFRGFFMLPAIAAKSSMVALILAVLTGAQRSTYTTRSLRWREPMGWLSLNFVTLLLMSKFSYLLWQNIVPLQFLQYPWRWMTINIFSTAVLCAMCWQATTQSSQQQYFKIIVRIFILVVMGQNLATDLFVTKFRSGLDSPESFMVESQTAVVLGEFSRYNMPAVLVQPDGYPGVPEYTPLAGIDKGVVARNVPRPKPMQPLYKCLSGAGTIDSTKLESYERLFTIDSLTPMKLLVRTYYYPGWQLYVDGVRAALAQGSEGEILIRTLAGKHSYRLVYEDTMAFKVGLLISLSSCCFMAIVALRKQDTTKNDYQ
jgi:hypothetical protein